MDLWLLQWYMTLPAGKTNISKTYSSHCTRIILRESQISKFSGGGPPHPLWRASARNNIPHINNMPPWVKFLHETLTVHAAKSLYCTWYKGLHWYYSHLGLVVLEYIQTPTSMTAIPFRKWMQTILNTPSSYCRTNNMFIYYKIDLKINYWCELCIHCICH